MYSWCFYFKQKLMICWSYSSVNFSILQRPPMKRVRKSLALDVMDCPSKSTNKRKSHKNEVKQSIKVSNVKLLLAFILILIQHLVILSIIFCPQREPMAESLSSSFCNKQDNILDQGFLMGPSDTAPFPSSMPTVPVSSTLSYNTFL